MKPKKISIIIPVYNEINTLEEILEKVNRSSFQSLNKEIILVDDASTDGSRELLQKLEKENRYKIYFHSKNTGKGAAIRTALNYITGDIVIIQDADLEYDPDDYNDLIKLIIDDKADVAYGSRLSGGKPSRSFKFTHYLGNKMLTTLTNLLYDSTLSDMETCYKAFKADVIKNIKIKSNRFEFEPEITAKILKKKYRLYETSISYYGRDYSEGKKITWKDGITALITLIRYRFFD
ncbi:MAG TPA: glycosyltransferase family 2 protein [Candidatus Gastranaerophilales bacterium]|nr:glycosyltransferase family 2 protein [Candidatus Gastranaerophilales bacterium]